MRKMVIQGFEYLGNKGSFLGEMEAFFVVLGRGRGVVWWEVGV